MDIGLDPFMCQSVARNDVQLGRTRQKLADIRKPRSARSLAGTAASRRDAGFSDTVAAELGLGSWERPATAPKDSEVGLLARAVGAMACEERAKRVGEIQSGRAGSAQGVGRSEASGLAGTSRVPNL